MTPTLLNDLIDGARLRTPEGIALRCKGGSLSYSDLGNWQDCFAGGLISSGIGRGERVALMLNKSFEFVAAAFGAAKAGAAFVPVNPVLKPAQVGHILRDCAARVIVLSPERLLLLRDELAACPALICVVVVGSIKVAAPDDVKYQTVSWQSFIEHPPVPTSVAIDNDMVAIFYTSGSTGRPKGVVLSHRNMVSGAISVASYLDNRASDRILAVLPLSFDAGFSQLTTAFHVGAQVVLLDYLMAQEVVRVMASERITGLTAVPPLYAQLADIHWNLEASEHLRYFANTGGRMPREVLTRLRARAPHARPFLMYGLTEAFRSTYLDPDQVDLRPDSIGKAIPNQEVLVLDADGKVCADDQPGELVHRGSTVSQGYWGDEALTWERFRVLELPIDGIVRPEIAVFSGDIVRRDAEGYLYFVGRRDDMIKSSGYRVSPTEIEEAAYDSGHVAEAAAVGIDHHVLGQSIVLFVVAIAAEGCDDADAELIACLRRKLPPYMVPSRLIWKSQPLPRNPNGKIDRRQLKESLDTVGDGVEA